jgi:hypothetical protein
MGSRFPPFAGGMLGCAGNRKTKGGANFDRPTPLPRKGPLTIFHVATDATNRSQEVMALLEHLAIVKAAAPAG